MKKHLLRTLALSCILCLSSVASKAQWVSIPNSNFGYFLNMNGYSQCLQGNNTVGWQMDTTCNAVISTTQVNCSATGISDLTGIEYFDSLQGLICNDNQLSSLPSLPNSLTWLDCSYNQLSGLPALPNSLTYLKCDNNQLTSLPALPDSLYYFLCHTNPHLLCLPQLKKIVRFYFSGTGITCLPNYPLSNFFSGPALNTVPLCDSANTSSCVYCHPHFSIYPDTANAGVYYGYNESYGSNLTSYLWEFGDGDTSGLQYPSHTYAQAGNYYLCLTVSSPDCTNTYCDSSFLVFKTEGGLMSQLIIRDPATGISSIPNPNSEIRISPNPATESVTISVDESLIGSALTITDITGRKVAGAVLSMVNSQWSMVNFASGVYFVIIANEKGKMTKKLVKQ